MAHSLRATLYLALALDVAPSAALAPISRHCAAKRYLSARRTRKRVTPTRLVATMSAAEPVLMRVVLVDGAPEAARDAVQSYPVNELPGAPSLERDADGARVLFRKPADAADADEMKRRGQCEIDGVPYAGGVADGGMRFRVVENTVEASRVAADPDELPKVIREKQLCKKMLARLEDRVGVRESSFRPVGSGSF